MVAIGYWAATREREDPRVKITDMICKRGDEASLAVRGAVRENGKNDSYSANHVANQPAKRESSFVTGGGGFEGCCSGGNWWRQVTL